jgi:uncharacterized protein (DUF3820 family)
MEDTDLMPFGKYKGEKLADVPDGYLRWLWQNGMSEKVRWDPLAQYIERALGDWLELEEDE